MGPAYEVPEVTRLEPAEVREITRTAFGMHDARWVSRFHSDERQAPDDRVSRFYLAGDAAHRHARRAARE